MLPRRSGPKKYIEVSGAMPTVAMSRRGKSTARTCITVSTPGASEKSKAPGDRVAVEKRAHAQERAVARLRLLQPEGGEDRELLRVRAAGADGEAAGGEAVDRAVRHGAEVARALEDRELVPDARAVQRVADADAAEAEVLGEAGRGAAVRVGEEVGWKSKKSIEKATGSATPPLTT